ncbi:MAG: YceI family protein [Acidobacteriota bacterium]
MPLWFRVDLLVHAAELRVLDPDAPAARRADVQARMLGAEVLDVAAFADIAFVSTSVEPAGANQWRVTGRLTFHGRTRVITCAVAQVAGTYHGEVLLRQRDFGIEPIRVAGGAVKLKDEVRVQFDIAR